MGFDLAGLYEYTYIMIVFLTIYLCAPSAAFRLKRFPCFKDLCERVVQYCEPERKRCYYCKDVVHNCGTDDMPLQCDAFCRDVEASDRERTLNETFENYNKVISGEIYSQGDELFIFIGLLVLLVLIIFGLVLYICIVSHKRARTAVPYKGQDVEETLLMPEAAMHHHNKEDKDNQDHNRESLNTDDAEVELQKDVSLQDEVKRDSKVSEDSAVGSLKSGDDHRNDESVPKIELAQGQNKHCGPTQENPATVNKEQYNNGVQNTRGMNPTKGENAKTFELAINTNPNPFLKASEILVAQPDA